MHIREARRSLPEPMLQRSLPHAQAQHEPQPLPQRMRPRNPQRNGVLQQMRTWPERAARLHSPADAPDRETPPGLGRDLPVGPRVAAKKARGRMGCLHRRAARLKLYARFISITHNMTPLFKKRVQIRNSGAPHSLKRYSGGHCTYMVSACVRLCVHSRCCAAYLFCSTKLVSVLHWPS